MDVPIGIKNQNRLKIRQKSTYNPTLKYNIMTTVNNKSNKTRKGETTMKAMELNTNVCTYREKKTTLKDKVVNYFRENQKDILLSMCSLNMNFNPYLMRQLIEK